MKCKWCSNEIKEGTYFCPQCGKSLIDNQPLNQNYNVQNANQNQVNVTCNIKTEKANIGLAILSFFIPLAGLIVYLMKKDIEPKTAKVSGICALSSIGVSMLVILLLTSLSFLSLKNNNILNNNKTEENIKENNGEFEQDDIDELEGSNETNESNGNNSINNTESIINVPTEKDWKSYKLTVNNTTITLPTAYNDLKNATGFAMKSSFEKSYLEKGYYTLVNLYKNDSLALYIEILNDTGIDSLYTDCKITRISQTKYQVSQGADIVYFPGGLKAGDSITEQQIIDLFGSPNDKNEYSDEGYVSVTYKYYENADWTTTNNYIIKVVNGVIDELQLDNRN